MRSFPIHAFIREYAADQPGGVIRWREAEAIYLNRSESARDQKGRRRTQFHQNISKILGKYFTRVEGAKGFYVLNSMLEGEL